MTASILPFPKANPKADRAFWKGPAASTFGEGVEVGKAELGKMTEDSGMPSDSAYSAPDTDGA